MTDTEQLLTLQQVAEYLSKPMSYVYELTGPKTRQLPVVYIGPRSPRVRRTDLDEFIAARTAAALDIDKKEQ